MTIAGSNGLSTTTSADDTVTVALVLPTSGTTTTVDSNSGLELSSDGLSLLRGCGNGELLKWNSGTSLWECSTDAGGASAIVTVQEEDVTIGTNTGTLDFLGADFNVTESPAGENNIAIDYASSNIVRSDQNETSAGPDSDGVGRNIN